MDDQNTIRFDEVEVLRVQVGTLLKRNAELEANNSRLHAMLQVLAQQQINSPPQLQPAE